MARKRYSDEDALKLLREIDVHFPIEAWAEIWKQPERPLPFEGSTDCALREHQRESCGLCRPSLQVRDFGGYQRKSRSLGREQTFAAGASCAGTVGGSGHSFHAAGNFRHVD